MLSKVRSYLILTGTLTTVTALLAICSLLSFAGQAFSSGNICELMADLRLPILYGLLFCAAAALILKSRKIFLAALTMVLICCASVAPLYIAKASTNSEPTSQLSVLELNLWGPWNTHYKEVVQEIHRNSADVVCLAETTVGWMKIFKSELQEYPYAVASPQIGGVGILSKFPIADSEIRFVDSEYPRIFAHLQVNNRKILIICEHTAIPIGLQNLRDKEFSLVATEASKSSEDSIPAIVAGDLNCTPWSYFFAKLLKEGKLSDTESGFGIQPTWCAWIPPQAFQIDHCLVSSDFQTLSRNTGRYVGSDHLPVLTKLSLKDTSESSNTSTNSSAHKISSDAQSILLQTK